MATLDVSMPNKMREWIDAQIKSGEYANASDYIRDRIRHDQRHRDALRLALIEGKKSGVTKLYVVRGFRTSGRVLVELLDVMDESQARDQMWIVLCYPPM